MTTATDETVTFYDDVLRVLAYASHQRDPIHYAIDVFLELRHATTGHEQS